MLYLKAYCYSKHELPFVIANLQEGKDHIDGLYLYEYNYTHTGIKKPYYMGDLLHLVPEDLRKKLIYKKIDLTRYIKNAYNNEPLIHSHNEPIQRAWFYNDPDVKLKDDDVIIDIDIDEIVYSYCYDNLLEELKQKKHPLSIRLNQFFFKHTYLWKDKSFCSPTIYTYGMVKGVSKNIMGLKIQNIRDYRDKTDKVYGCHMSWIMPVGYMVRKLHCYSHPKYRKFADARVLQMAVDKKVYIFDNKTDFRIEELKLDDERIPLSLKKVNIFDYLL